MNTVAKIQDPSKSILLAVIGWGALVLGVFLILALGMGWLSKVVYLSSIPGGIDADGASDSGLVAGPAGEFPVPDFRLPSLDGPVVSPAEFQGKVVVIDFWASWCGPCRLQAKVLEDLKAETGDGVQYLAVNIGEDEATVRRYVEKKPFSYPVLMDAADTLSGPYKIHGLPTVLVINTAGQVVFHQVGVTNLDALRREVQAAQG